MWSFHRRTTAHLVAFFLAGTYGIWNRAEASGSKRPADDLAAVVAALPPSSENDGPVKKDWLVAPVRRRAGVYRRPHSHEIEMSNGLVRRVWRVWPNAATVGFDNLMTGESILRGVKPEAILELDGRKFAVGGLLGQPDYAYLREEWLDQMAADPTAFQCAAFEVGQTKARFEWKRVRYSADAPWPVPGASLTLRFESAEARFKGLTVRAHYEMYDGIPLLAKWVAVANDSERPVRLNTFISEILAVVEYESSVAEPGWWRHPLLQVETDYAFVTTHPSAGVNKTAHWVPDPQYTTQVNYRLETPVLLEVRPPIGPDVTISPGETFESFRTFELIHDSTERERQGLALRRMYRTIAPWVTENPILMHVRRAEPEAVKLAIDQCAEVGFEMVIMTFGSGFNIENGDPAYLAQIRQLVDYGRAKGVELGGYSLLASRKVSSQDDVINPKTGKPGGAIFGNSPCLCSRWGENYFRKLKTFIETTGISVLEHDGSYPGDLCASTSHPGHRALNDSQWMQWKKIAGFYQWCRSRGVYLNVPDWYFLSGSNKTAMGYREANWSLPRERQIILARQNIFDGTWQKTPSMGWMFLPLVQYHGGGAAATIEPLHEHRDVYEQHLAQNFGAGVQACYRGPRLYDSEETKAVVKKWVDFYKAHRAALDSDIVHLRRPDGRDIDAILHVNPSIRQKGLVMVHNPLNKPVSKTFTLPLYYTGLSRTALIREQNGRPKRYRLDRRWNVEIGLNIPARSFTWLTIEAERKAESCPPARAKGSNGSCRCGG